MRRLKTFSQCHRLLRLLEWTRVRRTDVLQFGGREPSGLRVLTDEFLVQCMPLAGESVNVRVLLESLFRGRLGRFGYYSTFVRRTRAKVVIIWHDTNLEAYQLSKHIGIPIACIQNGIRIDSAPPTGSGFFTNLSKQHGSKKPRVDTYFVLSESEKARLSQFIDASFLVHGSLRANHFSSTTICKSQSRKTKRIGFIVSFPNSNDVPSMRIVDNQHPFSSINGQILSYSQYFAYDALVARALLDLCTARGLEFAIIGKRSESDRLEADFFSSNVAPYVSVLGHAKGDGYSVASDFDYLVTIDSTLGFEMLGLGKPVAFLPNRLRFCGVEGPLTQLSFLDELPSDGACWTSAVTEEAIKEFLGQWLDRQPSADDSDVTAFKSRVISVDPGNSKLRSYLRDCISTSS